jgi:hypothetical protein
VRGTLYLYLGARSSFIRDGEIRDGEIEEGRRGDLSLFIPNIIKMNVHSATCICSIELYSRSSGILWRSSDRVQNSSFECSRA